MQTRRVLGFLCASLVLILSLGCRLLTTLGGLKSTAESVATEVQTGREYLGTGEVYITEVAGSGAAQTAKAFVTQSVPLLKETARAIATDVLATPSEVPEDIPILEGEKSAFVGSARAISYIMELDFSTVLDFYQEQMSTNGWTKVDYGTVISDTQAELHFEKDERTAVVVIAQIPFTAKTMVVITIGD